MARKRSNMDGRTSAAMQNMDVGMENFEGETRSNADRQRIDDLYAEISRMNWHEVEVFRLRAEAGQSNFLDASPSETLRAISYVRAKRAEERAEAEAESKRMWRREFWLPVALVLLAATVVCVTLAVLESPVIVQR